MSTVLHAAAELVAIAEQGCVLAAEGRLDDLGAQQEDWDRAVALLGPLTALPEDARLLVRRAAELQGEQAAILVAAQAEVEAFHERDPLALGLSRETLRNESFGGISESIFHAVLESLQRKNLIVLDGEIIRSPNRPNELTDAEIKAKDRLLETFRNAKLEPPKLDDVLAEITDLKRDHARRVLQLLINSADVVKVSDEFYFHSQSIGDLAAQMRSIADKSSDRLIDVAQFKEMAGVSRKYAIPLLEYFDREKVTVRTGDKRLILK